AVLDLDIAIRVTYREVTRVEPRPLECRLARRTVLQIAHHDRVAGEKDLPHRLAVARCLFHRLRVAHHHVLERDVVDTLSRIHARALFHRHHLPLVMPGAYETGAVAFGESVDVDDAEAVAFHGQNHGTWRCGAASRDIHDAVEFRLHLRWCIGQHVHYNWPAAKMCDALALDRRKDRRRLHPPETDMRGTHGGNRPRKGPAVAMEHRKGPEIDRLAVEAERQDVAERRHMGAAMVADHAFGVAGSAGG